jgi:hypothetical protein
VYTAFIIRAVVLVMEAVRPSETSVYFYELHGAISQKVVTFILTAVRTSNLTYNTMV